MKTIPRKSVVQFLGFLTTYLPELKHTQADRLLKGWDEFIAQQEQRRTAHEERLTALEGAAVSYVRAIGSPFEGCLLDQLRRQVDNEAGDTKGLPEEGPTLTKEMRPAVSPYKPQREDFITCGVMDDAAYEAAMQRYRAASGESASHAMQMRNALQKIMDRSNDPVAHSIAGEALIPIEATPPPSERHCEMEQDGETHDLAPGVVCIACWNRAAQPPPADTAPDVCEHGIRKPWECRPCADVAWEARGASQPPPAVLPGYDGKHLNLEEHIERMACWREAGDVLQYVRELRDQIVARREQSRTEARRDPPGSYRDATGELVIPSRASQPPAPEWQPIETAPKNGNFQVCLDSCPDLSWPAHSNDGELWSKAHGPLNRMVQGRITKATHWRPAHSRPTKRADA